MQEPIKTLQQTANINMSADPVVKMTTEKRTARIETSEIHRLQPKHMHHNLWDENLYFISCDS